ncbi:MAG: hypothetical protein HQ474_01380 [Flammeovirgaceae bacterium]|jgi:hypothetical protein|nr:hypothetical protein [Flammeovirgaceae bacterium]|tara:strand:- start:9887 stop:10486 length:600 start_codon:yes stop_codon:yes gene_type:complete
MLRLRCFVLFLLGSFYGTAQFSSQEWHEGILVTLNQDTIRGDIKYDFGTNMITVIINESVMAYSSYKVIYFEIFDKTYKTYREFYTLPYKQKGDYETPIIFELQYEGNLSLLSRERIVQESSNLNYSYIGPVIVQPSLRYDFYLLSKEGKMSYFNGSKKELLNILSKKRNDLQSFIKSNKLKTDELRDLVKIIAFYNSI